MTPPQVASTSPVNGAVGVSRTVTIMVDFSEPVTGVSGTSYTVMDGASPVTGTIVMVSATQWNFTPDSMLANNAIVTVSLSAAIMDGSGNDLVATSFSFETGN